MAESEEGVPPTRRSSWLPAAMAGSFAIGASIAGYLVFKDDLMAWSRVEHFAWTTASGEQLTLLQSMRIEREVTGLPLEIVHADLEWVVTPTTTARLPGEALTWTQQLRSARVARQVGGEAPVDRVWPTDDDTADLEALPEWVGLLGPLIGVDLAMRLEDPSQRVESTTLPIALEEITSRRTGKALEARSPLDDEEMDALHAELLPLARAVALDLGAWADPDEYRPGQMWSREVPVAIGEWGIHRVKLEIRHDGYDGPIALLAGPVTRPSTESALSAEDGLSGLKGSGAWRIDVENGRVSSGRLEIEARGKTGRKFATIRVRRAFAVAASGQSPTLPPKWAHPPLVVTAEPVGDAD